ncbi:NAD(P)H-dependent oxidoreductase [Leptospira sp. 96542]|nr:NAD(P)H-dependent oxidoreductase [Leptospira sp. 96542]
MPQPKNILVINAHPRQDSLCSSMARTYSESAKNAGFSVKLLSLVDLQFDLNLRARHKEEQSNIEEDILMSQNAIAEADHLVFVFPSWWASMPALLKGWIDRVFLPGFAFRYQKKSPLPIKLLLGKTARIFITMDAPTWYYWLWNLSPGVQIVKKGTLEFCGVSPVRVKLFGPVRGAKPETYQKWIGIVSDIAKKGR